MKTSITIENLDLDIKIKSKTQKLSFKKNFTGGNICYSNKGAIIQVLKKINLKILEGENVGIIGHNGSGKSSLLRVISGIYPQTNGKINVQGKITALHNMMQGINPEMSGIENIYLRGYLLGLKKSEIKNKIRFISDFSELGDFLYLPVKTYSAGMISRLLFSITIIKKFDILLVDEGLGAGDVYFIEKVRKETARLIKDSKICIYVSQNINFLKSICNRLITLNKGEIANDERL